jgi:Protein of unknown function (DUF3455)
MKQFHGQIPRTTSRPRSTMCVAALAVACLALMPEWHYGKHLRPHDVPNGLEVPAGNRPFLLGHATGTQNYICLPSGSGFAWTFFGPQATLFNDDNRQIITHFLSSNPDEDGTARATWRSLPPPTKISLSRVLYPGCCSRWWERPPGPLGATGSLRPPIFSGCARREA